MFCSIDIDSIPFSMTESVISDTALNESIIFDEPIELIEIVEPVAVEPVTVEPVAIEPVAVDVTIN